MSATTARDHRPHDIIQGDPSVPTGDTALMDPTTTPLDIQIDRERAVTVVFEDGVECIFPVDELRAVCPCATCRGMRERGETAWPRPGATSSIAVRHAELNGAWGLSIDWSDGHSTGIYAWEALRRWWDQGLVGGLTVEPFPEHDGDPGAGPSPDGHR
jgi:DUF971 family protein